MAFQETLNNFGVFMDGPGSASRQRMVKPKYRWRCTFTNFGQLTSTASSDALTASMLKCGVPTRKFGTRKEVHSYNSVSYHVGKPSWEEIEMEAYDTYDNSVQRALISQQSKQFSAINQTSATVAENYKFSTAASVLDGEGNKTFTYYLEGCFITEVSGGGEWDYSSEDDQTVKFKISFDNCTFYDHNDNLLDEANAGTMMANILNL